MLYEPRTSLGETACGLRAVRKMTTHAEPAIRTTLRKAYSDSSLWFRAKTRRRKGLSQLDTQPSSAARNSWHLQRFELLASRLLGTSATSIAGASIEHANSHYRVSILVQHPALTARDNRQSIPFLSH